MRGILESVAARAATGWQRAGSKFDFEVFALPGGSVLAPALWVYAVAASLLKQKSIATQSPSATAAEPALGAQPAQSETDLSCAWPRCHCT